MYEFEKCEACTPGGHRCQNRAGHFSYVKENGAYLGFSVCETHRKQGERWLKRYGHLPKYWHTYWKQWLKRSPRQRFHAV